MNSVWYQCKRVLVHGGRLCVNVDATMNMEENSSYPERVHPLHVDFTNQLRDLGFIYRCEIIWCKDNAPGKDTCWGSYNHCSNPHIRRNTEYIIVVSKGSLKLEGDRLKSDLTKNEFHKWTLSEWRIKPETGKQYHPAPFPHELARRCIKLFSYVDNIVLDPFCGTGTTLSVAAALGRRYIGIDKSNYYCDVARNEVSKISSDIYQYQPSVVETDNAKKTKQNKNLIRMSMEECFGS